MSTLAELRVQNAERQAAEARSTASDARGRSLALQDIMLHHERRIIAAEQANAALRKQLDELQSELKRANERVEQALGHVAQLTRHLGEVSATARSTRERVDRMPWRQP